MARENARINNKSFTRRRSTLLKKTKEFARICNVVVGIVCFGPDGGPADSWPEEPAKLKEIITRYKNVQNKSNTKNKNLLQFLEFRKKKLEPKPLNLKSKTSGNADYQKILENLPKESLMILKKELVSRSQALDEKIKINQLQKEKDDQVGNAGDDQVIYQDLDDYAELFEPGISQLPPLIPTGNYIENGYDFVVNSPFDTHQNASTFGMNEDYAFNNLYGSNDPDLVQYEFSQPSIGAATRNIDNDLIWSSSSWDVNDIMFQQDNNFEIMENNYGLNNDDHEHMNIIGGSYNSYNYLDVTDEDINLIPASFGMLPLQPAVPEQTLQSTPMNYNLFNGEFNNGF